MLTDAPEAHGWCTLRAVVRVTTACRVHHVCCGSSEFHANHGLLQPTVTICLNRNPLSLTGGRPQSRGNENPSSFAGPPAVQLYELRPYERAAIRSACATHGQKAAILPRQSGFLRGMGLRVRVGVEPSCVAAAVCMPVRSL